MSFFCPATFHPDCILVARCGMHGETDEWKGWMQCVFLIYHYVGASQVSELVSTLTFSSVSVRVSRLLPSWHIGGCYIRRRDILFPTARSVVRRIRCQRRHMYAHVTDRCTTAYVVVVGAPHLRPGACVRRVVPLSYWVRAFHLLPPQGRLWIHAPCRGQSYGAHILSLSKALHGEDCRDIPYGGDCGKNGRRGIMVRGRSATHAVVLNAGRAPRQHLCHLPMLGSFSYARLVLPIGSIAIIRVARTQPRSLTAEVMMCLLVAYTVPLLLWLADHEPRLPILLVCLHTLTPTIWFAISCETTCTLLASWWTGR